VPELFCHRCGHRNPGDANFCSGCGAALAVGHEDLTVTIGASDATGEVDARAVEVHIDDFREAPGLLVVKRGTEGVAAGATFALGDTITVAGRSSDAPIFLDDVTVSRKHVEFQRNESGYRVVDLGSLNGTYVNRERIKDVELHNGDEVQIGKFRLLFFFAGE
jgi:hypothetical protein